MSEEAVSYERSAWMDEFIQAFNHPCIDARILLSSSPGHTTPESKKGSPKVNFPFKAMLFKSGERAYARF